MTSASYVSRRARCWAFLLLPSHLGGCTRTRVWECVVNNKETPSLPSNLPNRHTHRPPSSTAEHCTGSTRTMCTGICERGRRLWPESDCLRSGTDPWFLCPLDSWVNGIEWRSMNNNVHNSNNWIPNGKPTLRRWSKVARPSWAHHEPDNWLFSCRKCLCTNREWAECEWSPLTTNLARWCTPPTADDHQF